MNSFKMQLNIDRLESKLLDAEVKIEDAKSVAASKAKLITSRINVIKTGSESKITSLQIGIENADKERDMKVRAFGLKVQEIEASIRDAKTRLRSQKEVEAQGMGHSLDDDNDPE